MTGESAGERRELPQLSFDDLSLSPLSYHCREGERKREEGEERERECVSPRGKHGLFN